MSTPLDDFVYHEGGLQLRRKQARRDRAFRLQDLQVEEVTLRDRPFRIHVDATEEDKVAGIMRAKIEFPSLDFIKLSFVTDMLDFFGNDREMLADETP